VCGVWCLVCGQECELLSSCSPRRRSLSLRRICLQTRTPSSSNINTEILDIHNPSPITHNPYPIPPSTIPSPNKYSPLCNSADTAVATQKENRIVLSCFPLDSTASRRRSLHETYLHTAQQAPCRAWGDLSRSIRAQPTAHQICCKFIYFTHCIQ
jgi:hypothetical protein